MRPLSALVVVLGTATLAGCTSGTVAVDQGVLTVPPAATTPAAADPALLADASVAEETPVRRLTSAEWLTRAAESSGVPRRALAAYAGAALLTSSVDPGCRLDWATLAGIGYVESRHGTIDGGELGDDGRPTEPIFGPRLDGTRFDRVDDHDGGALDGDPEVDRAMGPLQIIPATWMAWASPGWDPQNIDQQAVTAARYLCAAGGDLSTESGWRAAIAAYNPAASYADKVAEAASRYASDVS
ncbi:MULTISPECIES: murein transglycosylase [unclassified Rathayibacter]|uniref:murein transglycosylase n=1 Tax=unclassified Rathayibacter TaxID=2609250 RepID=UPI00188D1595|nr:MULTISPECIES: murein transglycosylase [unclassified Rathayibacter]MBF4463321.1 murein transglycosylase [Rathayibacter sp. VKM Ac-2879]MBF4504442.1 murein transglycosylase [Rathayibacter sp. VKM Ac-2878]